MGLNLHCTALGGGYKLIFKLTLCWELYPRNLLGHCLSPWGASNAKEWYANGKGRLGIQCRRLVIHSFHLQLRGILRWKCLQWLRGLCYSNDPLLKYSFWTASRIGIGLGIPAQHMVVKFILFLVSLFPHTRSARERMVHTTATTNETPVLVKYLHVQEQG